MTTSRNGQNGNKVDETLISRLKKIEALARSGIEGERANAQRLLSELCTRYGVTLEELASDEKELRFFGARDEFEQTLLTQVVCFVCRTKQIRNAKDSKRRGWWFEVTSAQEIDIGECFAHYKRAWKQQLGDILLAFIAKNQIFGAEESSGEPMSEDVREKARRIRELMSGMQSAERWNKPAALLVA